MALVMVLIGRVLKPVRRPMTWAEKEARTKVKGNLNRVCDKHREYLANNQLAVLDEENCNWCKIIKEVKNERNNRI